MGACILENNCSMAVMVPKVVTPFDKLLAPHKNVKK